MNTPEGYRCGHLAIVGRPNVGKSSLLNQLLRTNRAIVTDIPGTTRDTLEETLNLQGIRSGGVGAQASNSIQTSATASIWCWPGERRIARASGALDAIGWPFASQRTLASGSSSGGRSTLISTHIGAEPMLSPRSSIRPGIGSSPCSGKGSGACGSFEYGCWPGRRGVGGGGGWLMTGRADLVGASIGAWRFAAACRRDPVEGLRELADTPVILLTAKTSEADKLRGFRLGVDDYITKPFSLAELGARLRAVLTRTAGQRTERASALQVGALRVDLGRREATLDGRALDLTPTEFRLLACLAAHPGQNTALCRQDFHDRKHLVRFVRRDEKPVARIPGRLSHMIGGSGDAVRGQQITARQAEVPCVAIPALVRPADAQMGLPGTFPDLIRCERLSACCRQFETAASTAELLAGGGELKCLTGFTNEGDGCGELHVTRIHRESRLGRDPR